METGGGAGYPYLIPCPGDSKSTREFSTFPALHGVRLRGNWLPVLT